MTTIYIAFIVVAIAAGAAFADFVYRIARARREVRDWKRVI